MKRESKLKKDLRQASYPALNWAARKAAENAENLIQERLAEESDFHDRVCSLALDAQGLIIAAQLWDLRQRYASKFGTGVIDLDELLFDMCMTQKAEITTTFARALDQDHHEVALRIGFLCHLDKTDEFRSKAAERVAREQ